MKNAIHIKYGCNNSLLLYLSDLFFLVCKLDKERKKNQQLLLSLYMILYFISSRLAIASVSVQWRWSLPTQSCDCTMHVHLCSCSESDSGAVIRNRSNSFHVDRQAQAFCRLNCEPFLPKRLFLHCGGL